MNAHTDTGTDIAIPATTDLVAAFSAPDTLDKLIGRIETEARSQAPDLSTAKGRAAIASLAFKVAKSKTALDAAGKVLNENARAHINKVDAERRRAWDRLEKLQVEVRAPLTEWEAKEQQRIDAIKARVERLRLAHEALPTDATADQIGALLARVEVVAIDDTWAEFVVDAARFKDQAIATLRHMLAEATKREAEHAELARLRAEALAREEADQKRQEAERVEAARLAAEKAETERAAQVERDKAEAGRIATEQAEYRAKAEAERQAREVAETQEKAAQAAADREAALKRQLADAEAAREIAAQVERDRVAAQAAQEVAARQRRESDEAHRTGIANAIREAFIAMPSCNPAAVTHALMTGQIPHVQVML